MRTQEAKNKAKRFLKEYCCGGLDYELLKTIIEKQGYAVIEFNHIFNDDDVAMLIEALKLSDNTIRSRGFTYADRNHRIVFVHEDLSQEEKLLVLAHEEGHIFCGHMSSAPIIGKDVQEEYEANEFAHYILNRNPAQKAFDIMRTHRKATAWIVIGTLLLIAAVIVFSVTQKEKQYYDEYYITESGNRYHEKNCIFVKDKTSIHRMTIEEFESGEYEPCGICLP